MRGALNKFFVSVFNMDQPNERPIGTSRYPNISAVEIFLQDVYGELARLDLHKTPGPDHIAPIVLRECRHALALPLKIIYTSSLKTGTLPQDWRDAVVRPIYKQGDQTLCTNYRPISLTCIAVKVLERLVSKRIISYLNERACLSTSQFGFRSGRNTVLQLLEYQNVITRAIENGSVVDVLYLDFQKAFDKVPHKELLFKLQTQFGILGLLLNWIRAYLSGRRQCVKAGNECSAYESVTSGVPQGSVLGPLLFLLYVEDLDSVAYNEQNDIFKFADDTKILAVSNNSVSQLKNLQASLVHLEHWTKE